MRAATLGHVAGGLDGVIQLAAQRFGQGRAGLRLTVSCAERPVFDAEAGVVFEIGFVVDHESDANACRVGSDELVHGVAAPVTHGGPQDAATLRARFSEWQHRDTA